MQDRLSALLSLPVHELKARGLMDTPREIHQQPETWTGTLAKLTSTKAAIREFLHACGIERGSQSAPVILLAGAGTSDYIGRAVSDVLRQHWGCEVSAVPSTDLLTNMADYIQPEKHYVLISFSRSGESSEGVAVLKQALAVYPSQVRHLVVTCNASSTMARQPGVFVVTLDEAVNDRGLAMTSSFSNMVIAGQYLAATGAGDSAEEDYQSVLQELVRMGSTLLPAAANMTARLAAKPITRVCFLGTGALRAAAEESSLKVLELNAGKIATLAQSPLGLRHGPMSFIDDSTLVVAYLSNNELRLKYELDLLEEILRKDLTRHLLLVAPRITNRIESLTGNVLSPEVADWFPDACRPPVDVIIGQLLGLFFAIQNGITPDTPSEGAISRVVSHVKIYPYGD